MTSILLDMEEEATGDSFLPSPRPRQPLTEFELAYPPPAWMRFGSCAQPEFIRKHGYDFMFPEGYGPRPVTEQKKVCAGCPVRLLCEDLGRDEPWGVWGGISRPERLAKGQGQGLPYDEETGRLMAATWQPQPKGSE